MYPSVTFPLPLFVQGGSMASAFPSPYKAGRPLSNDIFSSLLTASVIILQLLWSLNGKWNFPKENKVGTPQCMFLFLPCLWLAKCYCQEK